jgi:hypothetical protein
MSGVDDLFHYLISNNRRNKEKTMRKQYKTVPGPQGIIIKAGGAVDFSLFEELINRHATDGWIFHSMENVFVNEAPGCLGAILGQKAKTTNYYMLIFERDVE